jgi:hypothetical protein
VATQSLSETARVRALLTDAIRGSDEAAMHLGDIVELARDPNDERWTHEEALAILGQAHLAKRSAKWALNGAETVLAELVQQVYLAEEALEVTP